MTIVGGRRAQSRAGRVAAVGLGVGVAVLAIHSARLQSAARPVVGLEQTGAGRTAAGDAAASLLARQPLSAEPLHIAGRMAVAANDMALATSLYEMALQRDPRDIGLRLWLVEHYLKHARFADVVVQLDAVMRIRPTLRRQLLTVIVPLVGAPDARRAIADALSRNPIWASDFLDLATRNAKVAPAFYELVYGAGRSRRFALSDAQLTALVTAALGRGDYRSAWILYSRFAPRTAEASANRIYDADFRGAPGPAPFNWHFAAAPTGHARIASGGRLVIQVFGMAPTELASQTMLLDPGAYVLSSTAAPASENGIDGLSWRLVCDRTRRELGRVTIATALQNAPSTTVIDVPAQCQAATLRLVHAPDVPPVFTTTSLGPVSLTPVTGNRR